MNFSRHIALYLLLSLLFLLNGCKKDNGKCLTTSGKSIKVKEKLAPFNSLFITDDINVRFEKSSVYEILIQAPENILPGVMREVSNQTLTLQNQNRCEFLRGYRDEVSVLVKAPYIDSVYFDGFGDVTINQKDTLKKFRFSNWGSAGEINLSVHCDQLNIGHHLGSADISVSGSCSIAEFFLGQYGFLRAENMDSDICLVSHDGDGDISCRASKEFYAVISSYGNLLLYGNPTVKEVEITGEGELIEK